VTARKLLRKGCTTYLAYIVDLEKKEIEFDKIHVVREFPDVFPKELPGLPLEKKSRSCDRNIVWNYTSSSGTVSNGACRIGGIKNTVARIAG
jgi:hypothetical protein